MHAPEIFHLHYHVPDVDTAATALELHGIDPVARFGSVDGDSRALSPADAVPDGFRLRLQTNRGGAVDVTLTPGPHVAFDHLGVVVADLPAVVSRATERGWSVTENERRTFLVTPWEFRIELQSADSDVVSELGPADDCRFESVSLVVADDIREAVETGIRAVVGEVSTLRVRSSPNADPAVREATLTGRRVEDPHFEMSSLGSEPSV
ncbi:hypothetical protein C440_14494 [Haloferax mucosum ATCC BAA-1512]|uniref:VOC domain-containing protein n=1 Tax=Haloferax mucosum ATCC BAA-1512 TaxID=662479 RepID=M0I470_9EURY|nr:hypothetical protein [Haloferax mucosum]ELZ91531.1 hypothetical protein C440_14494 [Haloferax mucosum ATCC BAA-1512]